MSFTYHTNLLGGVKIIELHPYVTEHWAESDYFTEQPELIKWVTVVIGVTGFGCKHQRRGQEGHEQQVEEEGHATKLI